MGWGTECILKQKQAQVNVRKLLEALLALILSLRADGPRHRVVFTNHREFCPALNKVRFVYPQFSSNVSIHPLSVNSGISCCFQSPSEHELN